MGYVYFDIGALEGDETFEWRTQFDSDPTYLGRLEFTVNQAERTSGDDGGQVTGTVSNQNAEPATGPNRVFVACFDGSNLLGVESGLTATEEIPAAGFSPFIVDFAYVDACPAMAIAGAASTSERSPAVTAPRGSFAEIVDEIGNECLFYGFT